MAISQISIDTFFSALDPWDVSVAEGNKHYAAYVEQREDSEAKTER